MELNDRQFYTSYIIGILIAILGCSMVSAYYSYLANKKVEQVYTILEQWELTK